MLRLSLSEPSEKLKWLISEESISIKTALLLILRFDQLLSPVKYIAIKPALLLISIDRFD